MIEDPHFALCYEVSYFNQIGRAYWMTSSAIVRNDFSTSLKYFKLWQVYQLAE